MINFDAPLPPVISKDPDERARQNPSLDRFSRADLSAGIAHEEELRKQEEHVTDVTNLAFEYQVDLAKVTEGALTWFKNSIKGYAREASSRDSENKFIYRLREIMKEEGTDPEKMVIAFAEAVKRAKQRAEQEKNKVKTYS